MNILCLSLIILATWFYLSKINCTGIQKFRKSWIQHEMLDAFSYLDWVNCNIIRGNAIPSQMFKIQIIWAWILGSFWFLLIYNIWLNEYKPPGTCSMKILIYPSSETEPRYWTIFRCFRYLWRAISSCSGWEYLSWRYIKKKKSLKK